MKLTRSVLVCLLILGMYRLSYSEDKLLKICQYGLVTSTALDYYSGVRLSNKIGVRESNPVLGQNRIVQGAVMGASTGGTILLTKYLYRRGHKRLGIGVLVGGIVVHGLAASHNYGLK